MPRKPAFKVQLTGAAEMPLLADGIVAMVAYDNSIVGSVLARREAGDCKEHDGRMLLHRVLCYLESNWYSKEYGVSEDRWYGRGRVFTSTVLGLHGLTTTRKRACEELDICYGVKVDWRAV